MEQVNKKLQNKKVGSIGENLSASHLKSLGFTILAMNYLKQWGEIDVIAKKDDKVHFVEVKTVSYETKADLELAVARRTHRPEENVHEYKLKKLSRTIDTWICENNWQGDWQIDVIAVRIVPRETYASIKIIQNIIIG